MKNYIKRIFTIQYLKLWYNQFKECQGIVLKTLFVLWFILFYAMVFFAFYAFFILSPLNFFNSEDNVIKTVSILTFLTGLGGILYEPFAKLIDRFVKNGMIGTKIADWLKIIPVIPLYVLATLTVLFIITGGLILKIL